MQVAVAMIAGWFLCAEPTDAVKKDMAALEGEWTMVSAERNGEALPEDMVKAGKRVTKAGETTVSFGETVFMKAKFTVDPSKKLKTIDYEFTEGQNAGKKALGIYEIDGDTVKFCFASPDMERPTDFTAKADSGRVLSVWKKAKK